MGQEQGWSVGITTPEFVQGGKLAVLAAKAPWARPRAANLGKDGSTTPKALREAKER